ncbi:hypothetical protein WN943_016150 [Citrus x changshan-huyou]
MLLSKHDFRIRDGSRTCNHTADVLVKFALRCCESKRRDSFIRLFILNLNRRRKIYLRLLFVLQCLLSLRLSVIFQWISRNKKAALAEITDVKNGSISCMS